ncbi:cytochrome C oxidase assembly protein [Paenibacillus thalictri]|uniref:Cytochrome C oxidase assembly protein n=2 Tax=Paenibacillus thalictri TaxID=2527873 RepID=A0A4Q9DJ19_9BACL|nr:cytochrome C oxidase assembly protein [Paenibacillus thalictri]
MGHMSGASGPSWAELWSPGLALLLIVIAVLYMALIGDWRDRFEGSEPVKWMQKFYFICGLALIYSANGSPISYYGHHYMFSMHMLQQSILYLIAPILVILGLPAWLLRPLFKQRWAHLLMKLWTSPLMGILVFNMVFSFYHIPMIMNALMAHESWLIAYNALFLISAFQLWFPIFGPMPEYNRMSGLKKMGYIFINGILLTPACALIIFASDVMYDMYKDVPPEMMWMMTPIQDQQLGGVIMKIVQEFVYAIALAYSFFRWYRLERKQDNEDLDAVPQSDSRNAALSGPGNLNQA